MIDDLHPKETEKLDKIYYQTLSKNIKNDMKRYTNNSNFLNDAFRKYSGKWNPELKNMDSLKNNITYMLIIFKEYATTKGTDNIKQRIKEC